MHLTWRAWAIAGGMAAIVAIFVVAPPTGLAMVGFFFALVTIGVALRESPSMDG